MLERPGLDISGNSCGAYSSRLSTIREKARAQDHMKILCEVNLIQKYTETYSK
jgi:hypothetical protein